MKLHTRLAVALLAGAPAAALAQSPQVAATVSYTLHWTNSITGDQTPLSPGQGARLSLTALMTPSVGTVVGVAPGVFTSGNTLATLRGIQLVFLDLNGTGEASGAWTDLYVDEMWEVGSNFGFPHSGGAVLSNIIAGQFPPTWNIVMATNPLVSFWMGTWTPASYAPREVTFTSANGFSNSSPWSAYVLVRDATVTHVFVGSAGNEFGAAHIPIVPAPSALCLFGFGLLAAARHRQRVVQ
jgi:hypothetical protein